MNELNTKLTMELRAGTQYTDIDQIGRFTDGRLPSDHTIYMWAKFEAELLIVLADVYMVDPTIEPSDEWEDFLYDGGSVAVFLLLCRELDDAGFEYEQELINDSLSWLGQEFLLKSRKLAEYVHLGGGLLCHALDRDAGEAK